MIQAFVIVLREGFESFLIVAIIIAYLQKTGRRSLMPAVTWGIVASVFLSILLGFFLLQGANEPLWEGITGAVSAVMVTWFVVHMWQTAPYLKQDMESKLSLKVSVPTTRAALAGIFSFTAFMITREGMETALLLFQVHEPSVLVGAFLGMLAASGMAFLWWKLGRLIDLKLFFQVTAIFLLLFVCQILIYSFHEFTEAGVFPNAEGWHLATEPYGPDGKYGKWISLGTVIICGVWLMVVGVKDFISKKTKARSS